MLWHRHPDLAISPAAVYRRSRRRPAASSSSIVTRPRRRRGPPRYAREAGIPTIVDVEHVRPGIGDLLQTCRRHDRRGAAFRSSSPATNPGRALEAIAREFEAPLVCMTLGEDGSLARCGGREIRTPASGVSCVDTTGAGDAFRGGFAAGCLRAPDGEIEDVLALRERGRRAQLPRARGARRHADRRAKSSSLS